MAEFARTRWILGAMAGGLGMVAVAMPSAAIETPKDEKAKLKACEKKICTIILKKEAGGEDLSCNVVPFTVTWMA